MSDKTSKTPKLVTPKTPRRRRKVRLDDDPRVVAWCDEFIKNTEDNAGFTPTLDQALQAFLVVALRGIGDGK